MRRFILTAISALAITGAVAGTASANVAVDDSGHGWAGKGDVQTALGGINNSAIQNLVNTDGLAFTYVKTDTYNVVNAWATGNADNPVSLNSHQVTVTTTVGVNAAVNYDARKVNGQKQWTGFNLTGLDPARTTTIGTVPVKSDTVTYQEFSWTATEWDGTYDDVPNPNYNGHNNPTIKVKHMVEVTHHTDQLPVDENGNLYTEGNNKAVLSVELIDSTGGLYVNGHALPNTPPAVA